MRVAKLTVEEKTRILTLIDQGRPINNISQEMGVSRQAIFRLRKAAAQLSPGAVPPRKPGSGRKKTTTPRTDKLLKREVLKHPSSTAAALKKKYPLLLGNVAVRTVQHRLQKDLGLPARRAAKKPLLTSSMKKKRVAFCKKYEHWTRAQWKKVMFSDESTFRLVRGASQVVRRPRNVSRYDPHFTMKTTRHPESVMVWGAFSGAEGRAGLYFLPKGKTMDGDTYHQVLKDHLIGFYRQQNCECFMHDGAPPHRKNKVTQLLAENNIEVLEWPGNSPDLNPIENAWHIMKNKVAETQPNNINELKYAIERMWGQMEIEYFAKLAESMPSRIKDIIKQRGNMSKY